MQLFLRKFKLYNKIKTGYFNPSFALLTNLDVSRNQLTSLDLSRNTVLTRLDIFGNKFSADAMNALFRTLHGNIIRGADGREVTKAITTTIPIGVDRSIAERKGWRLPWSWQ